MDLGRAISKHAQNDLFGWDSGLMAYVPLGIKGGFQVYDRFISDRSFGQKKRNLLTPWQDKIPTAHDYIKVGDGQARFMVESFNEDVYGNGIYNNTYMLHEAAYLVEIGSFQGSARASGVGGRETFTVEETVWGDYDRYSAINSKEGIAAIDYTVINLYLPITAPITTDKYVRVDGNIYDVTELSRVNNILFMRCQKQGEDQTGNIPPVVCDFTIDFDSASESVVPGSGSFDGGTTISLPAPCRTFLTKLVMQGIPSRFEISVFDALLGSPNPPDFDVKINLYNSEFKLISSTTGNYVSYLGDDIIDGEVYLALVSEDVGPYGDVFVEFGITVP